MNYNVASVTHFRLYILQYEFMMASLQVVDLDVVKNNNLLGTILHHLSVCGIVTVYAC